MIALKELLSERINYMKAKIKSHHQQITQLEIDLKSLEEDLEKEEEIFKSIGGYYE